MFPKTETGLEKWLIASIGSERLRGLSLQELCLQFQEEMSDDEDEGAFGGLYENGHWAWDENEMGIIFVSDLVPKAQEEIQISTKVPTGTIEFRDDVDLIEQDVKDIALYTAPVNILSPALINMLHLPTTERFIRTLILFCQYYLQVEQEMSMRILELQTKMRTPYCDVIEREFADNLSDLRLLIAKEYCTMLIGGGDTKKFHHMGPMKKRRSLSDKDARLFETLLRMCVQIVWLALGRKSFNQIELEVNRIFKSEIFNRVEHTLKTSYIAKMAEEQRSVLLGRCVRHDQKLNTCSPLMNEVACDRRIDYRLLGLGVIRYQTLPTRLHYMMLVVAGDEEILCENKVVLGILGLSRSGFDTMLRPVSISTGADTEAKSAVSMSIGSSFKSSGSMKKSQTLAIKLYPDVVIPRNVETEGLLPPSFPYKPEVPKQCNESQRRRWQKRLYRLLHPQAVSHLSAS